MRNMKPPQSTWWHLVCLSAVFLSGSYAAPVQERETAAGARAAASKEDVNVLAFGVIQLTDALGRVKEKTGSKMDAIGRSLSVHDDWLSLLLGEARRASSAKRGAKEELHQLQLQMAGVTAQGRETQDTLARVDREVQGLWARVGNVEEYLGEKVANHIKHLQEKTSDHSYVLRLLQHFAKYQEELLDGQNRQLSRLLQMSEEDH
ncbi:uncharacterized protein angptl8 [Gadus morhua]|uniref:uncharacterized protein angptl8 n=1 Tax=Gadus morhua TaxID=8049 RepID=UPI0011B5DEB0|nr:uncharacterized protein LOC115560856 [Gadus morhua]